MPISPLLSSASYSRLDRLSFLLKTAGVSSVLHSLGVSFPLTGPAPLEGGAVSSTLREEREVAVLKLRGVSSTPQHLTVSWGGAGRCSLAALRALKSS